MAEQEYEYDVIWGPDPLDLAYSLIKGESVRFNVRQKFGKRLKECWMVRVFSMTAGNDKRQAEGIFRIAGDINSSGPDFQNLSHILCDFHSTAYFAKKGKGKIVATVYTD